MHPRFVPPALLLLAACTDPEPSTGSRPGDPPRAENGGGSSSGSAPGPGGNSRGDGGGGAAAPGAGVGLSARYPNDVGIASDPSVIFHSDFEADFAGWTNHTTDTTLLDVESDAGLANGGSKYLRASVSRAQLAATPYISAAAQFQLAQRVPLVYWRFYARFVESSAHPHHWVRVGGGNASYASDGRANTVPPGNQGFWFDVDALDDDTFHFYVYWHQMRSSRCNDGSAVPGCAGDQGRTNYYGNVFNPAGQTAFARDQWFCVEIMTKANTVGQPDGELALWRDDRLVGEYKPGAPRGRWLRSSFHSWGQYFVDQGPFEGFDFRTSDDVAVKRLTLDAYYQADTLAASAPETQRILYDDVVVATTRIGCKTK